MEKELGEFYTEGLAPHGGPGPCVDVPRGRGEAWVGVRAGLVIEPRNHGDRGADVVKAAEGNTVGGVMGARRGCRGGAGRHWGVGPSGALRSAGCRLGSGERLTATGAVRYATE